MGFQDSWWTFLFGDPGPSCIIFEISYGKTDRQTNRQTPMKILLLRLLSAWDRRRNASVLVSSGTLITEDIDKWTRKVRGSSAYSCSSQHRYWNGCFYWETNRHDLVNMNPSQCDAGAISLQISRLSPARDQLITHSFICRPRTILLICR